MLSEQSSWLAPGAPRGVRRTVHQGVQTTKISPSEESIKSQLDALASLRANVINPFVNAFGNTLNTLKSVASQSATNDVSTTGIDGSQSSTTWTFPHDLSLTAAEATFAAP